MSRVFVRSDQLEDMVFDVKLRIGEWKVLFAVDGKMDSGAIANFLEMQASDVTATLDKLQNMQFISVLDLTGGSDSTDGFATDAAAPSKGDEVSEDVQVESELETETAVETAEAPEESFDFLAESEPTPAPEVEEAVEEEEESNLGDLFETSTETDELTLEEETSADEDLDRLIGNLLEDDAPELPSTEELTAEEDVDTAAPEVTTDDEFDLGSIFQDESLETTEESVDEVLDSLGLESEDGAVEAEAPPMDAVPDADDDTSGTILVVDDSVVIRKMVEIALENESYKIVAVATGKEALTYLDENNPDLIILDIMLSDVNGLDILKAIKASKEIPVVMLSAKDTPRETSKAKQLGADDFIPKPFKDEELVSKIKELIKR